MKMRHKRPPFLPACALLISAGAAWAARPLVTDDARLTAAGSCQLESWVRLYTDSREVWALPACNPDGTFEITAGAGRASSRHQNATHDYVFQAKTLFRPLQINDWGWGLGIGTVLHPEIHPGPNLLGNSYAYVPVSKSFRDDAIVLHSNLGWLKERHTGRDRFTWGIGGEFRTGTRFMAIAETFGSSGDTPYWQFGGRFSLVPERVQIDATLGQPWSGATAGRWISIGLRLTPDRWF